MNFLEGQTVGIDLGTTYSAIAQLTKDGKPHSLLNADGRNITPSVVLLGEDGQIVVGPSFERISQESPDHIVEAVKRQMGNKDFYVVYQNKKLTAEFVSALILKKLKQDGEKSIGKITNAVITVPYYFNDVRRKATQDAGKIAGLNVVDIINEPTAATLAYAWMKGELGRSDHGEVDAADAAAVRSVIEQELSHTTPEERDIWYEELKSLPAGVVRDLLQVRKQIRALPRLLGGIPEKLASVDTGLPGRSQEINAEPASQKIRFHLPDQNSSAVEIEAAISQIRHNLTNSATPGFKRLRVSLVDAYGPSSRDIDSYDETTSTVGPDFQGEGCRVAPILVDVKQGLLKKTERHFDLAIDGEGFFVVRRGDRDFLTRCGSFTLDKNRHLCLVTSNDDVVLQPAVEIPFNVKEVQISADGTISFLHVGESNPVAVAQLQIAQVPSPARLKPVGSTLFVTTPESGDFILAQPNSNGVGTIQQGCLEQSNVDFEKESDELQELANILKSLPIPSSRPATATKTPQVRPH